MSKPSLIMVGVPSLGSIKTFTVTSLLDILTTNKTPKLFSFPLDTLVHSARQLIVENAIQAGASHLFSLDSDMLVRGDVLDRLIAHNKYIVGAAYNERRLPLTSTVRIEENGQVEFYKGDRKNLFKCHALGLGCCLINMEVFRKIEQPWFFYEHGKGEDVWFFDKSRKAGFDVWCDPTIDIRHIGDFGY